MCFDFHEVSCAQVTKNDDFYRKGEVSTTPFALSPVIELGLEAVISSEATWQKASSCLPINFLQNCEKDQEVHMYIYPHLQVELAVVSGPLRGSRHAGRTREMRVSVSIEISEIKSLITGRI